MRTYAPEFLDPIQTGFHPANRQRVQLVCSEHITGPHLVTTALLAYNSLRAVHHEGRPERLVGVVAQDARTMTTAEAAGTLASVDLRAINGELECRVQRHFGRIVLALGIERPIEPDAAVAAWPLDMLQDRARGFVDALFPHVSADGGPATDPGLRQAMVAALRSGYSA